MTRTEAAIQLRDHALAIARRHGSYQSAGDAKFLTWKGDGFAIMLRTPFQGWATGPDVAASTLAATHGLALPEWADDGRTRVISFKRGAWEAEFLALIL